IVVRTAIAIRIRNGVDVERKGAEAGTVRPKLAGEREGKIGAPMKAVLEGDDSRATSGGTGDFDGVLYRLSAAVDQQSLLRDPARRGRRQAARELNMRRRRDDMGAGVGVERGLLLDGGNNGGVAVAHIHRANAAGEVDKSMAVHIHYLRPRSTGGEDRVVGK